MCCEYPGFFIPALPPKEAFLAFKQEDSDSLLHRKLGIKHFLEELASHPQLSREENTTFSNFLTIRSQHQFGAFKQHLANMSQSFSFVAEYAKTRQLATESSTARQIKDYMAGAAFSLSKSFISLGIASPVQTAKASQHQPEKQPALKY